MQATGRPSLCDRWLAAADVLADVQQLRLLARASARYAAAAAAPLAGKACSKQHGS